MTIDEISGYMAKKTGATKKDCEGFYNAFVDMVVEQCNTSDEVVVNIPKIGKLTVKVKDAYVGKNPRTGEPTDVPKSRRVTFSAFPSFKALLNTPVKAAKAAKTVKKATKVEKK